MWSDNETERDFLNFSTVAVTVSQIIEQANSQPISIGVSGSWGVGELGSWGVGELGSWGVGELGSWGVFDD